MESPACSTYRRGEASIKAGDYRSALGLFDEAVRLARKEKNRQVLALALVWKGNMHRMLRQVNAVCNLFFFSLFLIPPASVR